MGRSKFTKSQKMHKMNSNRIVGVFQIRTDLADTIVIPGLTREPLESANLRGLRVKPAMTG